MSLSLFDPVSSNGQLVFVPRPSRERGDKNGSSYQTAAVFILPCHLPLLPSFPLSPPLQLTVLPFSHHSLSLLNCTSFLPPERALARTVLLGTGLSLTAHFVKSLSFVCDDCPPRISEQLVSRTAGARGILVCSQNT